VTKTEANFDCRVGKPGGKEKQTMQRFYEVMFIVRPDVADEDLDKLVAGFEQTVTNGGGTVRSTEKLGRRKLAYLVRKFQEGSYVLLTIDAGGTLVAELERRLRVSEPVIKFITVRMDEEEKRLAKVRAIRATRKKLSAIPPAEAAESAPAPTASTPAPVASAPAPAASAPAAAETATHASA
jgi:small subunit ribosomal protein S6